MPHVRCARRIREEAMKAVLDGTVIAEADRQDLISIEGNWYFPPQSVREGVLSDSPTPYTCPWKGACQYYTVSVGDTALPDRAWAYPERSEEHTSELQSLMRSSYAVFCLKK